MKPREGIVGSQMGDEYMLVPVGEISMEIHGIVRLNDTGAFIWKGLEEGQDEQQIARRMAEEYQGVDFDGALSAVRDLVSRLYEAKLLE